MKISFSNNSFYNNYNVILLHFIQLLIQDQIMTNTFSKRIMNHTAIMHSQAKRWNRGKRGEEWRTVHRIANEPIGFTSKSNLEKPLVTFNIVACNFRIIRACFRLISDKYVISELFFYRTMLPLFYVIISQLW